MQKSIYKKRKNCGWFHYPKVSGFTHARTHARTHTHTHINTRWINHVKKTMSD